ncbi:MAG: bifunctional diaminohydroxyphosphoribosylaminopyrimidine deaminase/5-amino-6-(5-phosphoribosylamino)uracil reductase RibD [bacterium]
MPTNERFMKKALQLARKGLGKTSPNPVVGCVIVKDGEIVGEGYHQKAGTPHAEVHALHHAGEKARGATAYVTLEPCSHFGKTPPCADALIAAGIKHVVIATQDQNPLVSGKGIAKLRSAGIKVEVGCLEQEAKAINDWFFHYIETNTPFVIGKLALSLDGKIATKTGDSQWISSEEARNHVHRIREQVDGIVVGKNTALHDNPRLTARRGDKITKTPYRIILDASGEIPVTHPLIANNSDQKTIIVCSENLDNHALLQAGVHVIPLSLDKAGRLPIPQLLKELGSIEIASILVEGGGQVMTSFLNAGAIQRLHCFVAPIIVGNDGIPGFGSLGTETIAQSLHLLNTSYTQFGDTMLITGVPTKEYST